VSIGPQGNLTSVTVLVTAGTLIAANPKRVALSLSSPVVARVTISDQAGVTAGVGFVMEPTVLPFVFRIEDQGSWLQKQLYAITSVGTEVLGMIEATQ
jgi:hypothetical protein